MMYIRCAFFGIFVPLYPKNGYFKNAERLFCHFFDAVVCFRKKLDLLQCAKKSFFTFAFYKDILRSDILDIYKCPKKKVEGNSLQKVGWKLLQAFLAVTKSNKIQNILLPNML